MRVRIAHLCRASSTHGAALVMTVIVIALITVMVLGFAEMVRYETVSSSAHQERIRAEYFTRMGPDVVTGVLRKETTDPSRAWNSMPGALVVPAVDATGAERSRLVRMVNLHSGLPSPEMLSAQDQSAVLRPANLNVQTFADQQPPTHLITDQKSNPSDPDTPVSDLPVRWIYVRKDGSLDQAERPPLTDAVNPLVGRFAFWTDDESTRINLNTSWKRNLPGGTGLTPNGYGASHPTSIHLASIPGMTPAMAEQLHAAITPLHNYSDLDSGLAGGRFFNSIRETRTLGPDFVAVCNAAKFDITHYNHDPDSTYFNEPRIVLTTQKRLARGRPFLDILKDSGTDTAAGSDPGTVNAIDPVKLARVISGDPGVSPPRLGLLDYLRRSDWPMVARGGEGSSFQRKYYPASSGSVRLTQLALNIIDYVRSAESSATLVEPLRGIVRNGIFVCDAHDPSVRGKENSYKGLSRNLSVTEMGVWVKEAPETTGVHAGRYKHRFFVEVHLPKHGGIASLDLTNAGPAGEKFYVFLYEPASSINGPDGSGFFDEDGTALSGRWLRLDRENISGNDPIVREGGYATMEFTVYRRTDERPETMYFRTALMLSEDLGKSSDYVISPRLEVCPVGSRENAEPLAYRVDAGAVAETSITSFQTDDPHVNSVAKDWNKRGQLSNTFGSANRASTLGQTSETVPPQDLDRDGRVTDAGLLMPYRKGDTRNPHGVVQSSGELGHIHTGLEITSSAPSGGIPWRTLRLQPSPQPDTVVPDWALMDLFTVPIDVPALAAGMFAPHDTATGGRINLNAQIQPYGDPALQTRTLQRKVPLIALLTGVPKDDSGAVLSATDAESLARNIATHALADGGKSWGHTGSYDSPGEVVEIKGVADRGEESEATVRGIANLIGSRGGVFTIYSIGQALQQTRSGTLKITAEQRHQTMIERYAEPSATGSVIRFRRVGFRPLNP